jgi:hypothetical protein
MRSGKDVVADYLVEKSDEWFSEKWGKRGWAEGLKTVVSECFGLSRDEIEKLKTDPNPPPGYIKNIRQALQLVGDDFRQIKASVWIDWTLARSKTPTVIPDGRYVNELKAVREQGGINVLVIRPGFENSEPHPSEAMLRPIIDFYNAIHGGMIEGRVGDFDHVREGAGAEGITIPPGAEYIDFVIRNDKTVLELQQKVEEWLVPFMKNRLYNETTDTTVSIDISELTGSCLPGGAYYATIQGGLIDSIKPIWGRMGEWVIYKQYPNETPSPQPKPLAAFDVMTKVLGWTSDEAIAMGMRLEEMRRRKEEDA